MKFCHSIVLATVLALALTVDAPARTSDEVLFSQAELDQMLAPIALYPDTVLSHVLIAATYPLEVIQAARWSRANPGLSGQDAVEAVDTMNWDPSVMALVAFPELLYRLDEDIEWTHRLGDAFLLQEELVVGTIQTLRSRAHSHGQLQSNEHVRVVREKEYIYIEPARTRVVHLPYYDPYVVYGGWLWSNYPPIRWHHPIRAFRGVSFFWGPAYRIAPTFYFSSFHWSRRQVVVVNHHHHHHYRASGHSSWRFHSGRDVAHYKDAHRWQHKPQHRRGVSYRHQIDERHRGSQARAVQSRAATAQQQISSRSSQRSWASDRRESLRFSDRSATVSAPQRSRQTSPARLRSSEARPSGARSATESGTTRAAPSTRSVAPSRSSAGRVRERLQRSPATQGSRSSASEARQSARSPAASRPVTAGDRSRNAATRPSARFGSSRSESAPAAQVRRELDRTRAPARSSNNAAPSRSVPRVAPSRSTAPSRSSPSPAMRRSQPPPRSYGRPEATARPTAPVRSAGREAAPRRSAPARSMPRSTPGRSAAPARQAQPSRQRSRSSAGSRERSRVRD